MKYHKAYIMGAGELDGTPVVGTGEVVGQAKWWGQAKW